ncbi:MAG: diacylglycerol kinase family protein [Bacteroidia bacterium]|nr:diacylglycerol kinase family protein [Bacteroidia bacterium]
MRTFLKSVGHAWSGVVAGWSGRNFRIQTTIGILAIATGVALRIARWEWCVVLTLTALVLSMELINTAIEKWVDHVSPEYSKTAGAVKDIAAGAVLVMSIFSATAGLIIFIPHLINLISL